MATDTPEASRWVRHNRARYVTMYVACIIEIERVGVRWHTTLTNIFTGQITELETRSPLSIAIQQAEKAAEKIGNPNDKKED